MIFSYEQLVQFRNARLGNRVITFDDLHKERNFTFKGQDYHCWIAKKDKREFILPDEIIKQLPIKIIETEIVREDK